MRENIHICARSSVGQSVCLRSKRSLVRIQSGIPNFELKRLFLFFKVSFILRCASTFQNQNQLFFNLKIPSDIKRSCFILVRYRVKRDYFSSRALMQNETSSVAGLLVLIVAHCSISVLMAMLGHVLQLNMLQILMLLLNTSDLIMKKYLQSMVLIVGPVSPSAVWYNQLLFEYYFLKSGWSYFQFCFFSSYSVRDSLWKVSGAVE